MNRPALHRIALGLALTTLAACRTVGPDYAVPAGSAFQRPEANADDQPCRNQQQWQAEKGR